MEQAIQVWPGMPDKIVLQIHREGLPPETHIAIQALTEALRSPTLQYRAAERRLLQTHPHHPRHAYCIGRAMQRAVLLRDALTIDLAAVIEMQWTGAVIF